jgi:hypothetical protein
MPTTFATEMLRRRNSPSGISGELIRASMARKTTSSAAAAASRPSGSPDVQPLSLPLMTA